MMNIKPIIQIYVLYVCSSENSGLSETKSKNLNLEDNEE